MNQSGGSASAITAKSRGESANDQKPWHNLVEPRHFRVVSPKPHQVPLLRTLSTDSLRGARNGKHDDSSWTHRWHLTTPVSFHIPNRSSASFRDTSAKCPPSHSILPSKYLQSTYGLSYSSATIGLSLTTKSSIAMQIQTVPIRMPRSRAQRLNLGLAWSRTGNGVKAMS